MEQPVFAGSDYTNTKFKMRGRQSRKKSVEIRLEDGEVQFRKEKEREKRKE